MKYFCIAPCGPDLSEIRDRTELFSDKLLFAGHCLFLLLDYWRNHPGGTLTTIFIELSSQVRPI